MTPRKIAAADVASFDELKSLAAAKGVCITLVEPIPNPLEIRTRLKNAIRRVEKKLADHGADGIPALLEPIHAIATDAETERKWANSLIVFRSPETFRRFWLHQTFKEALTVANRFQIRPALGLMGREQRFFILALSRQRMRLFRCTQHGAEEVQLRGVAPENMRDWLNIRQPDHVLKNRSYGGASVGSMQGVTFGTSTDREREPEYLAHFLKEVEKGVTSILRMENLPLILAGVEYEMGLYRKENTYQRLLEKGINGAPDHVALRTLHQHAMGIVMQVFSEPLRQALADFEKNGRISFSAPDIVKAASEGRVADLFLSESAQQRGIWDEQRQEIVFPAREEDGEDLLNLAALQTLLHGGRAFVLKAPDMPGKAETAAVLRF